MIPVDPTYRLVASGNVEPAREWGVDGDGKRKPLDTQASSEVGTPLWEVEVLRSVTSFGATRTAAVNVQVGSNTEPKVQPFEEVAFKNLQVEFFPRKGGGLGERWVAEGLAGGTEKASARNE